MSSIDDFVVACEVGDLAWMRRCLRSGLDPVGRDRQVGGRAWGSIGHHYSLVAIPSVLVP